MAEKQAHGIHLARTSERVEEIDALRGLTGSHDVLGHLLDHLNHRGRRLPVPGLKSRRGIVWERGDNRTERWWPQGISTSADAFDTEDIEGRKVIAVSWYAKKVDGVNQGSRISFWDLGSLRYRHVLLVRPEFAVPGDPSTVTYKPLAVHAGGIVWAGDNLYVAGTARGIFTCRLDDMIRIPDSLWDRDPDAIGRTGEGAEQRLASFGYRYVLPVRFGHKAYSDEGVEPMRYSFLSLDRTGASPHLIAGEYGRGKATTRLSRFALEPDFRLSCDADGISRPVSFEDGRTKGMQGATVVGDTWYVTSSRGPWGPGSLFVGRPGAFREHRYALPMGPEDICYWPSMDRFWSVSEHPGRRWIFSVPRRSLH